MTGKYRWPELESALRGAAVLRVVAIAIGLWLIWEFPGLDSPAARIAALAGVGAIVALVIAGVIDIWFYRRPTPILFEVREGRPAVVVGLVPQAAPMIMLMCLAAVGASLAAELGAEQFSLTRTDSGPFVPLSLLLVGVAAFALWGGVTSFPGPRPELVITARGLVTTSTGRDFAVGWGDVVAVREVNTRASLFRLGSLTENYIAIDTPDRRPLRIDARHVKPSAYDVYLLIQSLAREPAMRARIGRVSSVDDLTAPALDCEVVTSTAESLAYSAPKSQRSVLVGLIVALMAVPYGVYTAGGTPFLSGESDEVEREEEASQTLGWNLVMPTAGDPVSCDDLGDARSTLTRLLKGLQETKRVGRSQLTAPSAQSVLNAGMATVFYAQESLGEELGSDWQTRGYELAEASVDLNFIETSVRRPAPLWQFLTQQHPELTTTTRSTIDAIDEEC